MTERDQNGNRIVRKEDIRNLRDWNIEEQREVRGWTAPSDKRTPIERAEARLEKAGSPASWKL